LKRCNLKQRKDFNWFPLRFCDIRRHMGSAVNDLQRAILGGQQPLTQLLRQTKVIAADLNLEDVEQWVDLELGGYPKDIELPKYRTYMAQSLETRHPMYGWQFAGHLGIPVKASVPIAEIENYAKGEAIAFPVTDNFTLRDQIGDTAMVSSWPQRFLVAGSQFKKIIDAVTDELLRWTTELQKRGIKGENMNFDEQEKRTAGNLTFNIGTVHGAVGNLSHSPTTINNTNVTLYEYNSIQQLLVDHKIPKQDRRELEDIMDELKEASPEEKHSILARAEKWIVKHKELLGVGAEVVGKAVGAAIGQ
jgi:hypothetical protein